MKKLLTSAGLALVALAFILALTAPLPSQADTAPVLPDSGYTATLVDGAPLGAAIISTQTASTAVIDTTGKANLAVQFTQAGAAASATNVVTYSFDASLDNSSWVSGWKTAAITGTGTTTLNVLSNSWALGGIRKVRIRTIDNAAAGTTPTNTVTIKAATQ